MPIVSHAPTDDSLSAQASSTTTALSSTDSAAAVHADAMGGAEELDRETVTSQWLVENLEDRKVLVVDCRGPGDFHTSHIEGAIHLAIPSLMLRRLKRGLLSLDTVIKSQEGKQPWPERWKSETVVVYEDNLDDDSSVRHASIGYLIFRKLHEDGCHVRLLKGGFSSFESCHPTHCVGVKDCDPSSILGLRNLQISDSEENSDDIPPTPNSSSMFPVEVLPFLFLGNAKNSADLECLYRNGIRYIVNVTPNMPNTFEADSNFSYMQIPINDHWSQNLAQYFPGAISFIDEARSKKCGVLVHCLAGISRSVTVTVAYLMSSLSLSLNDAYDFVKRCKPNISPNFNFMGQLLDFEQTLVTSRDCGCHQQHNNQHGNSKDSVGHDVGLLCTCSCNKEAKTYFSSPTSTSSSVSSTSSSTSAMTSSSSTAFDYDIPPTPS